MTYVITEACVDVMDRACLVECPVDCIREGVRMLYIDPDSCIDCGACEPSCPVEAIYHEDNGTEQSSVYIRANAEFFDPLGTPGGASKVGGIYRDVGPAARIPPRTAGTGARRPHP